MLLTLCGRSFIKIQYSSFPLFPVAYPFRIAINLGNKNMKIGIFTGATSVRLKNIFTYISQYSTESMK